MIKYEADDALAMLRPGEDHLVNVRCYSMIIWNGQKVNQSNSVLKPLPRLPNVPKVAYLNLKMLVNIEGI